MIKIKKNTKKKDMTDFRVLFIGLLFTIALIIISFNLFKIQFIQGKELSEKAYNQQVKKQIISPNRGTIYDANGEILAQSISVDTVSLNPGKVKYSTGTVVDNEVIASGISEIFDVTYEDMMDKLTSGKSVIVIEKKVEKEKVEKLKKWMGANKITTGINVDEDSKRYYPYEKLASNLIGFCGTDNSGQIGIEERWNSVLTGTAGKVVTTTDVHGNAISDEDEQYVATENGSNIYLTIDANIQGIVEKYLKQAVSENTTCREATSIIMNPQNGQILAMASYPDFNLNNPQDYSALGYSEEEWNSLEAENRTTSLLNLWKNKAVTSTYEPGSTFKLVTASVGLEEGVVMTDTPGNFYCSGSYVVADYDIKCWRSYNPHGSQTLREALCNSCNPAFMQLGQKIGAHTLYNYYKAFGFMEPIGNDISKAYKGQFYELDSLGPVELATASFGQRFEISPLQLISAVATICNDGVLVKPQIVKEIENTDIGSKEIVETKEIRQVISKETAEKVKDMMLSVVTDGTGKNARVSGYSIGGKSGTSEPRSTHMDEGYVASFVAISPIENTQVVVLVALSGLQEYANHQGGQVAGPVCSQILSEVLPILGVASTSTQEQTVIHEQADTSYAVPNLKNITVKDAMAKLQQLGFKVVYNGSEDPSTALVQDQVPKYGVVLQDGASVCLYTSKDEARNEVTIPNVKDMPMKSAIDTLRAVGLNVSVDGSEGVVVSQDPTFETIVEEGTVVNIVVKERLVDAQ